MKTCPNPYITTCNAWAIDCTICPFRSPLPEHPKKTLEQMKIEAEAERQYCANAAEAEFGNS